MSFTSDDVDSISGARVGMCFGVVGKNFDVGAGASTMVVVGRRFDVDVGRLFGVVVDRCFGVVVCTSACVDVDMCEVFVVTDVTLDGGKFTDVGFGVDIFVDAGT